MSQSAFESRRPCRCTVAAGGRLILFCWALVATPAAAVATETFNGLLPAHRTSYFLMPPFNRYAKSNGAVPPPKMARAAAAPDSLLCAEESAGATARRAPSSDESLYVNDVSGRVYRCSVAPPDVARPPPAAANERSIHVNRRAEYDFIRFGRSAPPFRDAAAAAAAADAAAAAASALTDVPPVQKKQADKKASGQTYDYIRFGKRTVGHDRFGA